MANLVETETASDDTQHLNAIYDGIKSYKRRIADLEHLLKKAGQEIESLRADVRRLQAGQGITVEIDGKRYALAQENWSARDLMEENVRDELSQHLRTVEGNGWHDDQPRKPDTVTLDNSFLLSKD